MHPFATITSTIARTAARTCVRPPVGALLAALAASAGTAAAQVRPTAATVPAAVHVSEARPHVERAQASFERRRRRMLPRSRGSGGCDVRIGRFCYWYSTEDPAGPPEPARIGAARRHLLATLDSAATADPTDDLVAGQRVRYWLEAGAPDTALAAARACKGTGWWCAALRGWALHEAGDAAGAGAAFDSALAAMPGDVRCAWRDLSLLLAGEARKRYAHLGCAEREAVERRFWWLATPFFSRGGNDRRNEHFARRAMALLARESATTYDSRWGDDMEELLLRYGWAERWSRRELTAANQDHGASVVGHEPMPAHQWVADARLLEDPSQATAQDWAPYDPQARERFAAPEARLLVGLDARATSFRRGDSMLVVTTFARPREARLDRARASVATVREDAAPTLVTPALDSAGGVATTLVRDVPHLVSVEMLGDSGAAARVRFAVSPPAGAPGQLALSGLLPYRPERDADTTFDDAVRLALRGSATAAPERLGIYWEVYGLAQGRHPLETSLSIVGERAGWLERAWRRVRGRAAGAPVNLHWTDLPLVRDERAGRSIALELPALEPGRYTLQLCVRASDRRAACAYEGLDVTR